MKKFILGLIVGITITASTSAFADTTLQTIEAYLNPSLPITLDGKQLSLNNVPITYQGTTYLPLRDTATIVGKDVNWNESTRTVELISKNYKKEEPIVNQVFYNYTEVSKKYPFYFHEYDKDFKLFVTFEENDYHLERDVQDFFPNKGDMYYSHRFLAQYLTEDRLNEFQSYNIDFETKEITPIN